MQCLFNTERSQTFSKPNFPAAFTRRDSSATAAAAGGGLRRTVSGRSEEFGLDRQEDFNISRHATELLTRISDADVPVPNDTESPHSQAKNSDLEPSKLMLELSLSDMNETARRVLVAAPADDSEQEDHEEDEPQLVCGLVDYCVVLGPSSAYTMRPTHQITEKGELQRLNLSSDQISLYQATISSPTESTADHLFSPVSALSPTGFEGNQKSVNMGLFSPVNTTEMTMWLQNEDLECKVWDRLPKEDHEDIELPSKVSDDNDLAL